MTWAGLKQGSPIEMESLPDGGIGIYAYGRQREFTSLWDVAVAAAMAVPGIEDVDLELPPREIDQR